jgi:glyoxylase-like metal-dependent hydrolase (beta-lactamase superfamily II)
MAKVSILIEGYAHEGKNGIYVASSTTSLIKSEGKNIMVDPGTNEILLIKAFKKSDLKKKDISFIYLSHYHPDHFLNIRLFPNTDIYDGEVLWREDEETYHDGKVFGGDVELIKTPGHSLEHTSLLVKTEKGVICLAQDVFWWEDGKQKSDAIEDLINLKDPFAADLMALKKSRKLILDRADWIIPGHGKMFKNPKRK